MGILEQRLRESTGNGAHLPNSGIASVVVKAFDRNEKRDPNGRWTGIRLGSATPKDVANLRAAHASGDKTATHALTRLANESNQRHRDDITAGKQIHEQRKAQAIRDDARAALNRESAAAHRKATPKAVQDANQANRDDLARMHQRRAEAPGKAAAAQRRNEPYTIGAGAHEAIQNMDAEVAAPTSRDVGDWSAAQLAEFHPALSRGARELPAGKLRAEATEAAEKVAAEKARRRK